eukprot:CAMPEP_0117439946 /NCGR_PEP_ID=MMETSP0759-20121206/2823_1 /TAXON_ID=63605 /ORGANISM="Percolomonas cosmopolitus, Strain WS" /LENGTH=2140 /DNA_ID=CAMNT_0005231669 /DNA_START=203 /DNA_END=6621 /DNA_ORIENTATION=-
MTRKRAFTVKNILTHISTPLTPDGDSPHYSAGTISKNGSVSAGIGNQDQDGNQFGIRFDSDVQLLSKQGAAGGGAQAANGAAASSASTNKIASNDSTINLSQIRPNRIAMSTHSHYIDTPQFIFSQHYPRKDDTTYVRADGTISENPWYHEQEMDHEIENPIHEQFYPRPPRRGLHPSSLKMQIYEKHRASRRFLDYTPRFFRMNQNKLEPLKDFSKYKTSESIRNINDFQKRNRSQVKLIHIENVDLASLGPSKFKVLINNFCSTEILVLRNCEVNCELLDTITELSHLRVLDVVMNDVKDYRSFIRLLDVCPHLQMLQAQHNPCFNEDAQSDKNSQQHTQERIIAHLLGKKAQQLFHLEVLNNSRITPEVIRSAVQLVGVEEQQQALRFLEFDTAFSALCKKISMKEWDPGKITSLNLSGTGIQEFHVGSLFSLRKLNVDKNAIQTLSGCGLEQLTHLKFLDFSHNDISDLSCFETLQYCPSLLHVVSHSNPYPKDDDHRLKIIYHTRFVKGTNNSPGIWKVDSTEVSISQRMDAVNRYGRHNQQKLRDYHMELVLIHKFGHHELRCIDNFARRLRKMILSNQELTYIDLTNFRGLEYLDMHNNVLRDVANLDLLKRLKFLNLAGNSYLNDDRLTAQLKKLSNLRHLILKKVSDGSDSRSRLRDYRVRKLSQLLDNHPMMVALDSIKISIDERVDAMKENGATSYQLKQYAFSALIMEQIVQTKKRSYAVRRVAPGVLYYPSDVTELHLSGVGLVDFGCDFSPFVNLELLDISDNDIVDIEKIGLTKCHKLRVLDMRNNKLQYKIRTEFVPIMDCFPDLEVLAVAGNPMDLKKESQRIKFLKGLKSMQGFGSKLGIVDTKITSSERQRAWDKHSETTMNDETRCEEIMASRGYLDCAPDELTKINLNDTGLSYVSMSEFSELRILLLRGCRLKSLSAAGILSLTNLRCIDLRNNFLSNIDEVLGLMNINEHLETISVSGNTFKMQNYRSYLVGNCIKLRLPFCVLWELDEKEITVDEVIDAWSEIDRGHSHDISLFRFNTAVFRKYITNISNDIDLNQVEVVRQDIVQLNLSGFKLSFVNFEGYENLTKLSLANNKISDRHLASSYIASCPITELDVSGNRIQHLSTITELINTMPNLEMIFFAGNDCYRRDTQENRYSILSKLTGCKDPEWKLAVMNGITITVDERIESLKMGSDVKSTRVEGIRTALHLHMKGYHVKTTKIDLNDCNLFTVNTLSAFDQITHLNLSGNHITSLCEDLIKSLKFLYSLDLTNNNFTKESVLKSVAQIPTLRVLRLKGNAGMFTKAEPEVYAPKLFRTMRALHMMDDISNPYALSTAQTQAAYYLWKYFDISPNSLTDLDFTFSHVERRHFWVIVLCLRELVARVYSDNKKDYFVGPKTVQIMKGNFKKSHVSEYRFILVNHVRTLEEVDGHHVSSNEKLVVFDTTKQLKHLIQVSKKQNPNIAPRLSIEEVQSDLVAQRILIEDRAEEEMFGVDEESEDEGNDIVVDDAKTEETNEVRRQRRMETELATIHDSTSMKRPLTADDVSFELVHRMFRNVRLFKLYEKILQSKNKRIRRLGGMLDKLELIFFFLQLFSITYAFNIKWPSGYYQLANIVTISNLSIEVIFGNYGVTIPGESNYLRFFLVMMFPILFLGIFFAPFQKKVWDIVLARCWPISLAISFVMMLLGIVFSIGMGFAVDHTSATNVFTLSGPPTWQYMWVATFFTVFFGVCFVIFVANMILFRRVRHDNSLWNALYLKLRTRIALFLLTVSYMPVMRAVFVTFQCQFNEVTQSYDTLLMFPELSCPTKFEEFPWIWYVAAFFALFYIILIPLIFIIMIVVDYRTILVDYSITQDERALKRRRKLYRSMLPFQDKLRFFALTTVVPYIFRGKLARNKEEKELVLYSREIRNTYEKAVEDFNSASSFLYSPYKRSFRFYRIFLMALRVILCALASTVYRFPQIQIPVGACVLLVYALLSIITRPYTDFTSTLAEIFVCVNACWNILFGYYVVDQQGISEGLYKWPTSAIILYATNGINLLMLLGLMLTVPIRALINRRRVKGSMVSESNLREDASDDESEHEHIKEKKYDLNTTIQNMQAHESPIASPSDEENVVLNVQRTRPQLQRAFTVSQMVNSAG